MVSYATQLNQLKDKYTNLGRGGSNSFLRCDRQRGDYMSTLLLCNESDFFVNLYRVIESNRLVL